VAEWLKAPVSKTGIPVNPVSRVRISPCPLSISSELRTELGCLQSAFANFRWLVLQNDVGTGGRVV
jgi:hypothetical protein